MGAFRHDNHPYRPFGRWISRFQLCLGSAVAGVPGLPEVTTTITGKQIPPPGPKFGGVLKEKASESKAWWLPRVVTLKGAPPNLARH